ncbi:MAG: hypothetical protein JWQ35_1316 [Bacteriovoracaceae bacterium]|nr:hypothetical protein [Bacteriovoracaceae bacterium]
MKLLNITSVFGFLIAASGCGSSGGDSGGAKEFAQSVDKVSYNLSDVNISATLGSSTSSNTEQLQKTIGEAGRSKDDIQRIIKGPAFVLMINSQESALQISSAGNIDHKQTVAEKTPGCELSGLSQVSGVSTSLRFELNWELTIALAGSTCDAAMLAKYIKFQTDELNVFHLNSVQALLNSADLAPDAQRMIHLQLKIAGDSH